MDYLVLPHTFVPVNLLPPRFLLGVSNCFPHFNHLDTHFDPIANRYHPHITANMAPLRRSGRSRRAQDDLSDPDANISTRSTRQTRAAAARASISVSPSPSSSSGDRRRSLRLTLKMPAGKLREATGGRSGRRGINVFQDNPIVSGPRTSRNRKKLVETATSDEEIEDQEEDEVDDEDAPGEDDEDADADGDLEMDEAPPQPPVRRNVKQATATRGKAAKSVEEKEMEMEEDEEDEEEEEEDDENISETDSDAEGEPDDQDESAVPDVNVDDLDEEDEEDELEDDMDSDALAMEGKQTKRQRGNLGNDFLQLPMGKSIALNIYDAASKRLVLTREQNPKSRST